MAYEYTAETSPYKTPSKPKITKESDQKFSVGPSQKASYTPNSNINEHAYGQDGSTHVLGTIPSVVVGGSSEVGQLPAMPGTLKIGENKNVSTPVSG